MKLKVRKAQLSDISSIINVENNAWSSEMAADERMFESRIKIFPEGQLVALIDNHIIGVVSAEIIIYDFSKPCKTWYELTDNGYIKNVHNQRGNVVFGVDLSVESSAQNKGVARKLLQEIGKMAIRKNIQYGVLGGRLPGYYKFSDEMDANTYAKKTTQDGEPFDPELRFYKNSGLMIGKIIPNYFKDYQSMNYGIQLIWKNPFFLRNKKLGRVVGKFLSLFFKI
ncbi:GNAT family N-acetyltransferase [Patescibacteria group bacterium]